MHVVGCLRRQIHRRSRAPVCALAWHLCHTDGRGPPHFRGRSEQATRIAAASPPEHIDAGHLAHAAPPSTPRAGRGRPAGGSELGGHGTFDCPVARVVWTGGNLVDEVGVPRTRTTRRRGLRSRRLPRPLGRPVPRPRRGHSTGSCRFLELGGKSATIVLEDADLGLAAMMGMGACFHAGQGCAIQTRMLLPRSRYEEGVELLKKHVRRRAVRRAAPRGRDHGPALSRPSSASACWATSRRARPRAPRWPSGVDGPWATSSPRVGGSSPRCSPTSTTP